MAYEVSTIASKKVIAPLLDVLPSVGAITVTD